MIVWQESNTSLLAAAEEVFFSAGVGEDDFVTLRFAQPIV